MDVTRRRRPLLLRVVATTLLLVVALALAALGGATPPASAAGDGSAARVPTTPAFHLAPLGFSYSAPLWVGGAPGSGALYVAQQDGRIFRQVNGTRRLWLNLHPVIGNSASGEQGLLSMAFAHDFTSGDGRVFAYLTLPNGNGQVRQFQVRDEAVVSGSGRIVINVSLTPPVAENHNGGQLWSRPGDMLYLSVGDGGGGGDPENNAQDLGVLMGKMLRIDPGPNGGYSIPPGNPFIGRVGARAEVWALGLRNPWRYSFDRANGQLWIGDVGQGDREEVDVLQANGGGGSNFGWRRFEGTSLFSSATGLTSGTTYRRPRLEYGHTAGRCSITGGVVYRGPISTLRGWYLYADLCASSIWGLQPVEGRRLAKAVNVGGIVHFGEAGRLNHVYVASVFTGRIYRIDAGA